MAFKGITFAGQNVTPKNDGGLYGGYLGDGIIWGCSMNISGDDLVIQSGEFIAGGRMCQVDGATNVDLSTRTLTNGYIQVVMDFDVSKPEGEQWNIHLPLIESATTTFPALTYDDINDNGTLHQFELAIVQVSGGNLTSIYRTALRTRILFSDESGRNGVFGFFSPNLYAYTYDSSNGNPLAGLRTSGTDNAIVFAPNQPILIRPKGANDATNQTQFNTGGDIQVGGQIIGGHPLTNKYLPSSVSVPANTTTSIMAYGSLDASAVYQIEGAVSFTPNSNSGGIVQIGINSTSSSLGSEHRVSWYFTGTAQRRLLINGLFTGGTTAYLLIYSSTAGTVDTNTNMKYVRIN